MFDVPMLIIVVMAETDDRPRWDAAAHARWQKKVSGGKIVRTDETLSRNRADRNFQTD